MAALQENFIGILQHRCQLSRWDLPKYIDHSSDGIFKFICKLKKYETVGTGHSKKIAKHYAAQEMLTKLDENDLKTDVTQEEDPTQKKIVTQKKSSVAIINEYCSRKKIDSALFADLPKEDKFFIFKCTFDGFSAIGEGHSKKEAKERAAFKVVQHFGIDKYFSELNKFEEESNRIITPFEELSVYCREQDMPQPLLKESEVSENNIKKFKFVCSVGGIKAESSFNISKKSAKLEASKLLLQILKGNTPISSPKEDCDSANTSKSTKNNSTDDNLCCHQMPSQQAGSENVSPSKRRCSNDFDHENPKKHCSL